MCGAGAVLDWGAPKTICNRDKLEFISEHGSDNVSNRVCCLTHLFTATGFKTRTGERITQKIFNLLKAKPDCNPNFESIISVIEDLYTYWSTQNSKDNTSLFSLLNLQTQIKKFQYYKASPINPTTNNYSLSIPHFPFLDKNYISEKVSPQQKYYQMFLNEILGGIKGHVSKYSYYTAGHNKIFEDVNHEINSSFCTWMKSLADDDFTLRMYTLNYDRLFKVLLQEHGLDVFEGFELKGASVGYNQRIPPDLVRIVKDFTSHIHYNLHGSAYWSMEELNANGITGYQYFLRPYGDIDGRSMTIEIEKGKQLLLTNIISGYQKVQRTAISPFRQMLSAFDRDCLEANRIYIIGYSLADEHINDIIRNARKYNSNAEIILINPEFDDVKFMLDFLSHWGIPRLGVFANDGEDIICPGFNVRVIRKKFGDFLTGKN